jgi:hypothetical protein
MPALGRGMQAVFIMAQADQWPNVDVYTPTVISQAIIVALTLGAAWMYGKLKHPATWWAVAINLHALFVFELGKIEWIQRLLTALIHV